jgi:hypothetical protein
MHTVDYLTSYNITKYLDRSESIAAHSHSEAGQYATAHP